MHAVWVLRVPSSLPMLGYPPVFCIEEGPVVYNLNKIFGILKTILYSLYWMRRYCNVMHQTTELGSIFIGLCNCIFRKPWHKWDSLYFFFRASLEAYVVRRMASAFLFLLNVWCLLAMNVMKHLYIMKSYPVWLRTNRSWWQSLIRYWWSVMITHVINLAK